MKKVFLAAISLTLLFSGASLFAQDMSKYGENASECVKYLSYSTRIAVSGGRG